MIVKITLAIIAGSSFGIANLLFGTIYAPVVSSLGILILIKMLRENFSYRYFYITGVICWSSCVYWVVFAIERYLEWSFVPALFCGSLIILVQALEYILLAFIFRAKLIKSEWIWLPLSWCLWELVAPKFFPWGLGNYYIDVPILRMLVPIFGIAAVGGIIMFFFQQFYIKLNRIANFTVTATLLILGICNELSFYRSNKTAAKVTVGVIQPNLTNPKTWNDLGGLQTMRLLTGELLTKELVKPELIIWPESAISQTFRLKDSTILIGSEQDPFPGIDVPIIFGAQTLISEAQIQVAEKFITRQGYGASAIILNPAGKILGNYLKKNLFPFSEGFPFFRSLIIPRNLNPNSFDTVTEATKSVFKLDSGIKVGLGVCYDDLFYNFEHISADIIVFILNDLWFKGLPTLEQHFQLARVRALESGIPFVRVGNTGVSAVVDAAGVITWRGELDQRFYKLIKISLAKPSLIVFPLISWILNMLAYFVMIFLIIKSFRRLYLSKKTILSHIKPQ